VAITQPPQLLRRMFDAAIASAQAERCVPPYLPHPPRGRVVVIGAGKASAAMARAVEQHWPGPLSGLVVTRHGYRVPCERIEIVEASHPVPDACGLDAAARILALVRGLRADDLVLCLMSGGGSALLPMPLEGVTLADKQALSRSLLACGVTISEINCVRRHLSAIKGGRLAAACHPARVVTLAILRRHGIALPAAVRDVLESGRGESVKPGDPRLAGTEFHLIAAPQLALEAAARVAREAGYPAHILGDSLEGEARDVGSVLAGLARQVADRAQPFTTPCVLLSGGETTVTVRGNGRGGPNVECLLAMALALGAHPRIHALAGGTDGVDGSEDVAGALIGPWTLARATMLGLRPRDALANNDAHGFFRDLGQSVVTGPTLTNVNDFRAVLVENC
jgi:hydroxypyruvate reductase